MNSEEKRDEVTIVLDSLCKNLKRGTKIPNSHTLTLAMKRVFGDRLWLPPGNIFSIVKTKPLSWGTEEKALDEAQNKAQVSRLKKKLLSYL